MFFSGIGWSMISITWKCWLLRNKWVPQRSRKKRVLIMSKTSINGADGEANWLGVVNFHCTCKWVWCWVCGLFLAMTEMICHVHNIFLLSGKDVISLKSRAALIFMYLYKCTQSIQKQIVTYDMKSKYPEILYCW